MLPSWVLHCASWMDVLEPGCPCTPCIGCMLEDCTVRTLIVDLSTVLCMPSQQMQILTQDEFFKQDGGLLCDWTRKCDWPRKSLVQHLQLRPLVVHYATQLLQDAAEGHTWVRW